METITKSPTKRRALAALDANALPSPKPHQLKNTTTSPLKKERKRPLDEPMAAISPLPQKRACFEVAEDDRSRSQSPDTSSIFDTSANDSSWATEPEASPAPRVMTREQAREKAEILRLRLGLASYKFRTGQTSVPLANLQRMPLPPRPSMAAGAAKKAETAETAECQPEKKKKKTITSTTATTASVWGAGDSARPQARAWGRVSYGQRESQRSGHDDDNDSSDEEGGRGDEEQADDDGAPELPRLSPTKYAISALRGAGERGLSDRVLSGGAADGLLSLSRSNSDV